MSRPAVVVRNGEVVPVSDSYFRLSLLPELFWGFINALGTFFSTMFYGAPKPTSERRLSSRDYRPGGRVTGVGSFKNGQDFKCGPAGGG